MLTPPLHVVTAVCAALQSRGAVVALGGSGLLAGLGLVDRVRDWDLTTDADADLVREALGEGQWPFRAAEVRDGGHRIGERFVIETDHEVEVWVGFAAVVDGRVVRFPTRVTGHWRGLPLGDPDVWARVYRAIGRPERAELLKNRG
ncbi:hypothetical protein GCM10011581_24280 [Saccharopolyspora subtropica]|uniref:Uncharacterized protein n=1 Tax=Saccharopolyspora thermophila TaxID=89367 RepID=A0A917JTX1_9PSEU|nr:hypothetical protein [Saccharopolyspora subtropica]GGI86322.1 hypothetical protein GCM10011581_24280 [Saccharopolyspora subtropica]